MADYEIEKAIAEQIAVEQTLTSSRLSWNLTFQGFMLAAYALIVSSEYAAWRSPDIETAICFAGIAVSLVTLLGVIASQQQRTALKSQWPEDSDYPKPFLVGGSSLVGRAPTWAISLAPAVLWAYLLFIQPIG